MSTVSPAASARVASLAEAASVGYVRAPVSGNPSVVRAGNLSFIVSGADDDIDRVEPVIRAIGPTVHRVGDGEQARIVKLAINLMIAGLAQLMSEALVLGEAAGVPRAALLEVMGSSAVGAPFVKYKTEALVRDDFSATFTTALMEKDIDLALDAADEAGVELPLTREMKVASPRGDRGGVRRRRLHRALPAPAERVGSFEDERAPRSGGSAVTRPARTVGSPDATRAVDWEQRVDFPRLRKDRLDRAKAALEASDLGAVLLFDPNNIRYVTSTHIGEWARDKNARFTLLARGADPILWDFGSAARHHQLFAPWLPPENFRAGVSPMRGAMPVETGIPDRLAAKIATRAARVRPPGRAARHRHGGSRHDRGAPARRRPGHRRLPGAPRGAQDQDRRGDHAARPVGRARRRRLRGDLPDAASGRVRARDRRACAPAPLRDGFGAGRGRQRRVGRPLQPASARVLGPAPAAGRPGVLRHHPLVHGLPNVLLPHVQRRRRQPRAARRVQAVPRVARRGDRARSARA